ncbi:molybdopterin-guanine dinucleotide biosynthesis protein B [Sneathiella chinensis]|uniref:Molybdopterin-guanine dinucleotide biosynthesis protein MobB n=1 Tax=Sneathiella chinensis TaxID=349750 RepID=A0ABQ5U4B9_9PROT|nr:molybdopterin-guanine dinucleotide biosynthesis protein B [Sneathiella chinensis]GLQ06246.1 molybdopterin-guanine dinucleotide biosynthesis protein MobB [Sneathiella chinensis]
MKVIGISGWSGNGKTSLVVRLIPALNARGFSVSTIKHAHHRFDMDKPGKDSHRHREAGAHEVLISSANRWALLHENQNEEEWSLDELIGRISPVDILLVEGFKTEKFPKIEVWRRENDSPLLHVDDDTVVAVATDCTELSPPIPRLDLNNADQIADFIVTHLMNEGA